MATEIGLQSNVPVTYIPSDRAVSLPAEGIALCLSGGGYRAMVFHLGALIRLNEAGLLKSMKRVSSVSGGSITAGMLGLKWKKLGFGADNVAAGLMDEVITPIRKLASTTIDVPAVLKGKFWRGTVAENVATAYDRALFGGATLQDLPSDDEGPRFVINATNVQTGVLWRFSKPYMADYIVGQWRNPKVSLAFAVTASSAFPPVLSPAVLKLDSEACEVSPECPEPKTVYTSRAILTDAGVYDNLGLETAWKRFQTILVSDGGGKMGPEQKPSNEWAIHTKRVMDIIDNQVRCLRKRQLIDSFNARAGDNMRKGTYWGIRSDITNYGLLDALPCDAKRAMELADTPTRLAAMDDELQERLINWGYAICDAALRKHYNANLPKPKFPYPRGI
jgi:NTE family protein